MTSQDPAGRSGQATQQMPGGDRQRSGMQGQEQYGATAEAQPLHTRTFVSRIVRSAALQAGGEIQVLTATALVQGRPVQESRFMDLWHRTRERVADERHDPSSRVPEIEGSDFIELQDVTVIPLASQEQRIQLDTLLVFNDEIVGIRATRLPDESSMAR